MTPPPVEATTAASSRAAVRGARRTSVLADYATLTKPRITAFVFLAALVGALLGAGPEGSLLAGLEIATWVACLAAGASTLNQVIERDTDRLMERTRSRPLPAGRVSARDALLFGALLGAGGTLALALRFGDLAALLGLATLSSYTLVYTPLKRLSSFNTLVGAFPGAAPPLVGYAAAAGTLGSWAWALFGVIFVWQFPHFMAIAWMHREDYRRAGMKMLPSLPGAEGLAGRQAFLFALLLLPVSLLPAVRGTAGMPYLLVALVSGAVYLLASAAFALRETRARARVVLLVSLVYLPVLFTAVLLDHVVRWIPSA